MARRRVVEPVVEMTEATEAEAVETKPEEITVEETAEEVPVKAKRGPGRRRTVKTEEAKAESAKAEKKPNSRTTAKKSAQKTALHIQYGGKSVSEEDLFKSARDVWKYDLKRKARELVDIELYVKPEEQKVYYVMNGDVTGSFEI